MTILTLYLKKQNQEEIPVEWFVCTSCAKDMQGIRLKTLSFFMDTCFAYVKSSFGTLQSSSSMVCLNFLKGVTGSISTIFLLRL
jgi:hypothetical protein